MNTIDIGYSSRLDQQMQFIVEIDKVKKILRESLLFDQSRRENDAEHSWTICIMALLLKEYANFPVDIQKVVTMLLIHDLVEIDAGDTFFYSAERENVQEKEERAAERIFGLLNKEQGDYLLGLWREFEEGKSNEAKFAIVFDRMEPMLQNYIYEGYTWKKYNIRYDAIIEKNKHIKEASEEIWNFALKLLDKAVEKGYLERG